MKLLGTKRGSKSHLLLLNKEDFALTHLMTFWITTLLWKPVKKIAVFLTQDHVMYSALASFHTSKN